MAKKRKKTKKKNTNSKLKKVLILFVLIICLILLYSHYVEPYRLIIKEYKIENKFIPKSFDGLKIIHLSDIHYGPIVNDDYLKKIVNLINKQKPDIVLFTGDFLDKRFKPSKKDIENIKNILSNINSNLGKYAVSGEQDMFYKEQFIKIMDSNFILLDNTEKIIYFKDNIPISIVGLSDKQKTKVNYDILNNDNNLFRIVLAHEPDEYSNIKEYNFNILLSGHSHNGQIRIPFIGSVYNPVGAKTYYDEYYEIDNKEIFISSGIGTSNIDFRFNSKPSINLYRFYAQ